MHYGFLQISTKRCFRSSKLAQKSTIDSCRKRASKIYSNMKEVYGEVQSYFVIRGMQKHQKLTLTWTGPYCRQTCHVWLWEILFVRIITTYETDSVLSINKGIVHPILHKRLIIAKFVHNWYPSMCQRSRKWAEWVFA